MALDGTGNNSPFTEALARLIDTPDLEVRHLMGKVRESVYVSTGERQLPWLNEALIGEFYFGGKSEPGAALLTSAPPKSRGACSQSHPQTASTRPLHRVLPAINALQPHLLPAVLSMSARPRSWIPQLRQSLRTPTISSTENCRPHGSRAYRATESGERIVLAFDRPRQLAGFEIVNGYAKNRDIFRKNARVRSARVTLSSGDSQVISLPDTMRASTFNFAQPVETTWVELQIESVFPGSKYTDTAVSEFVPVFAD